MESVTFIIELLLFLAIFQYFIAPMIIYLSLTFPEKSRFSPLNPQSFLERRTDTFSALHKNIIERDFDYIGSSELLQNDLSTFFSIYIHHSLQFCCTLSMPCSKPNDPIQINFIQLYEDGSSLTINNYSHPPISPPDDSKLMFRFPDMNDIDLLLKAAIKLSTTLNNSSRPIELEKGKEFSTMEAYVNQDQEQLINEGWITEEAYERLRRPTVKGAILMTWKLCWPVKPIINFMARRQAWKYLTSP